MQGIPRFVIIALLVEASRAINLDKTVQKAGGNILNGQKRGPVAKGGASRPSPLSMEPRKLVNMDPKEVIVPVPPAQKELVGPGLRNRTSPDLNNGPPPPKNVRPNFSNASEWRALMGRQEGDRRVLKAEEPEEKGENEDIKRKAAVEEPPPSEPSENNNQRNERRQLTRADLDIRPIDIDEPMSMPMSDDPFERKMYEINQRFKF